MPRSMQEILDHSEEGGTARVVDPRGCHPATGATVSTMNRDCTHTKAGLYVGNRVEGRSPQVERISMYALLPGLLVGEAGFEPTTSASRTSPRTGHQATCET
jgi:hypothetical protein